MLQRRWRGREQDRESGVTVVEFVVLTFVLFILMFGTIEIGLLAFARHVAVAAAQEGDRTAREEAYNQPGSGWVTASEADARRWVLNLAGGMASDVNPVATAPTPLNAAHPRVTVTVSFAFVSVVPWSPQITVRADSTGPVECFYTPQGFCNGG